MCVVIEDVASGALESYTHYVGDPWVLPSEINLSPIIGDRSGKIF